MSRPATILFVHQGPEWIRGSERVLLDLASGLNRARFRPVLWCDAGILRREAAKQGIEAELPPLPIGGGLPWYRPNRTATRQGRATFASCGADLLHVNTLSCLPWAHAAARSLRRPVVAHLHNPTTLEEREYSGLHQVACAVGVSRDALAWVGEDGMNPAGTRLIYNAVVPARLEQGSAEGLRASLGIAETAFVAAIVGSLIPRKDVGSVIEGFARALGRMGDAHLLVIGEGEERNRLQDLSAHRCGEARIHFLGEREDVGAILRDAVDALVAAARSETFGLTLIEAGYFGVPAIVTDIPTHAEIVQDGVTGVLVRPGDLDQLADVLVAFFRDASRRHTLGAAVRARVMQTFLAPRFLEEFEVLYSELLARPARRYGWFGEWRFPRGAWRMAFRKVQRRLVPVRADSVA